MSINEVITNGKDFDGVYFCKSKEKNGEEGWSLTFLSLNNKRDKKFEEYDTGTKYQIIFNENDKVEIFEAILADPKAYLQNLIDCNQEGMILKKCKRSRKIISSLLGKKAFRDFQEVFDGC